MLNLSRSNLLLAVITLASLFSITNCGYSSEGVISAKASECGILSIEKKSPDLIYTGPLNIAEAESYYRHEVSTHENESLAKDWNNFQTHAKKGGCIYSFTSTKEQWDSLRGVKGLVLINQDEIIEVIIIVKN